MTIKLFGNKVTHIQTKYENVPLKKCKKITANIDGSYIEIKGKKNIQRFFEVYLVKNNKCSFTTEE